LDEVLGALAAIGYDAEWHCIPASAVGAPHRRDRVWIVAYPTRPDHAEQSSADVADPAWDGARRSRIGAFAGGESIVGPVWFGTQCAESAAELRNPPSAASDGVGGGPPTDVAHPQHEGWGAGGVCRHGEAPSALGVRQASPVVRPSADVADAHIVVGNARWSGDAEQSAGRRDAGGSGRGADAIADVGSGGWWAVEPDVGRVAHGIPARVDRLRALGNAVVPQIPEILGRAILAHRASSDL
jgi:DNA (cytosine-5)-methyltransferase 1